MLYILCVGKGGGRLGKKSPSESQFSNGQKPKTALLGVKKTSESRPASVMVENEVHMYIRTYDCCDV